MDTAAWSTREPGCHGSWWQNQRGRERTRREFDYPDSGPVDIVAMGAPATARRVDRVPGDDLDRVLNGLKAGRNRFDDYCGYAWFNDGTNAWRVWRKGHKWRVERMQMKIDSPARPVVPANSDVAWWRLHEKEFFFELQAVCDGRTVWYYRYRPQVLEPNRPYVPRNPPSSCRTTVYGSADDPMMPWPHLLARADRPSPDRPAYRRAEVQLDAEPQDGPQARSGFASAIRTRRIRRSQIAIASGSTPRRTTWPSAPRPVSTIAPTMPPARPPALADRPCLGETSRTSPARRAASGTPPGSAARRR